MGAGVAGAGTEARAGAGRRARSSRSNSSFSASSRSRSGGRTWPVWRPMSWPQYFTMLTGRAPPNFCTVRPHHLSFNCLIAFRCVS